MYNKLHKTGRQPFALKRYAAGVELPALLQLIQERQTANAAKLFKKCNLLFSGTRQKGTDVPRKSGI
jgi:mannose/fructose-specific phosphotransferase system component IIA